MWRFTKGAFAPSGDKSSRKFPSDSNWPRVNKYDGEDSAYSSSGGRVSDRESSVTDGIRSPQRASSSRPWVLSVQGEDSRNSSTSLLSDRRATSRNAQRRPLLVSSPLGGGSKSRNSSVDSIRATAKRKLSNLFGGGSGGGGHSSKNKLSASTGAVDHRVSAEENFLTPHYVRRLLADEEKREAAEASREEASVSNPILAITDEYHPSRARLAEPELSISDDESISVAHEQEERVYEQQPEEDRVEKPPTPLSHPDDTSVEDQLVPPPEPECLESKSHKADSKPPKKPPAATAVEKKPTGGGFLGLFRRRIQTVMAFPPPSEKRRESKSSSISQANSDREMDALKSAFYNVAVFGMAACCILGAFAGYYLFYDFVKPIMWAVICGIVLYPLKRRVTRVVRSWLDQLSAAGTPLVVGVVALPLNITNGWGEFLLDSVTNNARTMLLMIAAFPASAMLLHFDAIPRLLVNTKQALIVIDHAMGVFKAAWVPVVLLIYVGYVCLCNVIGHLRIRILCHPIVSWTIWTAGLAHACSYFGPLRTLLFSLVLILCTTYYIPFIHGLPSPTALLATPSRRARRASRRQSTSPKKLGFFSRRATKPDLSTSMETEAEAEQPPLVGESPTVDEIRPAAIGEGESASSNFSESNLYLKRLFVVSFFVYISLHLWMMLLLIIPIGVALIRRLAIIFDLDSLVRGQWRRLRSALGDDTKLILPPPLVHFLRVLVHIDRQIIYYLRQSMDFVGSLTAMLLLVIGLALATAFVVFQLYQESIHVVQLSADIANQTLTENPALQKWLHESVQVDSVTELAEQASKKAMSMARTWLSQQVHEIVENDPERADLLESQIVSTLDTLVERWWRQKNESDGNETSLIASSQNQKTAIAQWADTWTAIGESAGGDLDWNLFDNLKEYLSVAWSLADSAWLIIKNNLEVLLGAFTQISSTLLASGSAVVDFFLDSIVFLTFLLYVLSESDDEYKPMKVIKDLVPGGRETASAITEQVEEAVNGVFFATSKIAIFYGMLTWLTHTLFAVNLVFIPSVLAALFAAIPFFGAYLVALPAVLELWVIRGEPFLAVLLFLLHYLPSYVVDDAIYSEITLTTPLLSGMAIAGGILWWGLEGAIFGPLVLCCILVLGGVYKKICFETMALSSGENSPESGRSRAASDVVDESAGPRRRPSTIEEVERRPNGEAGITA